jgi:hypothetical protein
VKATPMNVFTGTISLTCSSSNLPAGTSCQVSPSTLTIGSDGISATSTLTISTTARAAALLPPSVGYWSSLLYAVGLFAMPMLVGLAALSAPKRRRLRSYCLVMLLAGSCLYHVACGGSSSNSQGNASSGAGTPAGSYTITVTGSAGAVQHQNSVTLIVQ